MIRKQKRNVNKHTDRGTKLLAESIERDGWIGAITVAADQETFDGSNRIEVARQAFENAIVVESDGTKPVVVVRTDIPNADDPKARRLGFTANQIQSVDYNPDAEILAELARDDAIIAALAKEDARLNQILKQNPDNVSFKEYDESIADDVKYAECPKCGHKFPV